jgi:hypothetical protein
MAKPSKILPKSACEISNCRAFSREFDELGVIWAQSEPVPQKPPLSDAVLLSFLPRLLSNLIQIFAKIIFSLNIKSSDPSFFFVFIKLVLVKPDTFLVFDFDQIWIDGTDQS